MTQITATRIKKTPNNASIRIIYAASIYLTMNQYSPRTDVKFLWRKFRIIVMTVEKFVIPTTNSTNTFINN